jgi:hypothetical protein
VSEKTYDVLVTVNNDWLVFPSGYEGPMGWIARGVSEGDLENFHANDNLARDFIDAADAVDVVEIVAPWGQDSDG